MAIWRTLSGVRVYGDAVCGMWLIAFDTGVDLAFADDVGVMGFSTGVDKRWAFFRDGVGVTAGR